MVTRVTKKMPRDFFSCSGAIISMSPTHGAYAPRMRTGKKVRTWLLNRQLRQAYKLTGT